MAPILLVSNAVSDSIAQDVLDGAFDDGQGNVMDYRLWLAPGQDGHAGEEFPLTVWLHGLGGEGQYSVPSGIIDASRSERFASFVLVPQAYNGDTWTTCDGAQGGNWTVDCPPGTTLSMQSVLGILDELQTLYPIDPSRRFVGGYSAGSVGSFEALYKHPGVFSAAVPIQGGYDPSLLTEPIDARLWVLHGHDDGDLFPYWSSSSVDAITKLGGSPIYLEPPGSHAAEFRESFFSDADDELYPWLFEGAPPPLAQLLYDPSNGNVKIDATHAPGGLITKFTLSRLNRRDGFSPPAIDEINGDSLINQGGRLSYEAAQGPGFGGIVDLGNIFDPAMDFTQLHQSLSRFSYKSPSPTGSERVFRMLMVPEASTFGLLAIGLAAMSCRRCLI